VHNTFPLGEGPPAAVINDASHAFTFTTYYFFPPVTCLPACYLLLFYSNVVLTNNENRFNPFIQSAMLQLLKLAGMIVDSALPDGNLRRREPPDSAAERSTQQVFL